VRGEEREIADIRVDQAREEERDKSNAEKLESAKSMLSDGFSPSTISKHLKISIQEIEKLV